MLEISTSRISFLGEFCFTSCSDDRVSILMKLSERCDKILVIGMLIGLGTLSWIEGFANLLCFIPHRADYKDKASKLNYVPYFFEFVSGQTHFNRFTSFLEEGGIPAVVGGGCLIESCFSISLLFSFLSLIIFVCERERGGGQNDTKFVKLDRSEIINYNTSYHKWHIVHLRISTFPPPSCLHISPPPPGWGSRSGTHWGGWARQPQLLLARNAVRLLKGPTFGIIFWHVIWIFGSWKGNISWWKGGLFRGGGWSGLGSLNDQQTDAIVLSVLYAWGYHEQKESGHWKW